MTDDDGLDAAYQWLRSTKDHEVRLTIGDALRRHQARNLDDLRQRHPAAVVALHHQLSRSITP